VSLVLLAGCGFQLKGFQLESPHLDGLYIVDGDQQDSLAGVIQEELSVADVKLARSAEQATNRLHVREQKYTQRVISVDANGKVLEYELRLQAKFDVMTPSGELRIPQQSLELTRQLTFSGADELGRRNEAQMLRADMLTDMAGQIIRRLQAQLK
jgi:LPS-assembly lipoprotein